MCWLYFTTQDTTTEYIHITTLYVEQETERLTEHFIPYSLVCVCACVDLEKVRVCKESFYMCARWKKISVNHSPYHVDVT